MIAASAKLAACVWTVSTLNNIKATIIACTRLVVAWQSHMFCLGVWGVGVGCVGVVLVLVRVLDLAAANARLTGSN